MTVSTDVHIISEMANTHPSTMMPYAAFWEPEDGVASQDKAIIFSLVLSVSAVSLT